MNCTAKSDSIGGNFMSNTKAKSMNAALLGLFTAIIIVLQLMSYLIKIGTFNLSLVLIPIVLAAVMYGPKYASILGGVFGVIVVIASVAGLDGGGNVLFQSSPVLTTLVCLLKGVAAGFAAGIIANALKGKNLYLAVILSAVTAPVVNTGIFTVSMLLFFKDTLTAWANGADLVYYVIFGLIGINFIIELVINAVLSPVVLSVSRAFKKEFK